MTERMPSTAAGVTTRVEFPQWVTGEIYRNSSFRTGRWPSKRWPTAFFLATRQLPAPRNSTPRIIPPAWSMPFKPNSVAMMRECHGAKWKASTLLPGRYWTGRDVNLNLRFGRMIFPFMHAQLIDGTADIPVVSTTAASKRD